VGTEGTTVAAINIHADVFVNEADCRFAAFTAGNKTAAAMRALFRRDDRRMNPPLHVQLFPGFYFG